MIQIINFFSKKKEKEKEKENRRASEHTLTQGLVFFLIEKAFMLSTYFS